MSYPVIPPAPGTSTLLSFHDQLARFAPEDFKLSALPVWLPLPQRLFITQYFNQGLGAEAVQPVLSEELSEQEVT
ncbi:hypothetical protein SEPCBS119000_006792, partial [Sporothrix epigloea]